jgi:hypothetical protein
VGARPRLGGISGRGRFLPPGDRRPVSAGIDFRPWPEEQRGGPIVLIGPPHSAALRFGTSGWRYTDHIYHQTSHIFPILYGREVFYLVRGAQSWLTEPWAGAFVWAS